MNYDIERRALLQSATGLIITTIGANIVTEAAAAAKPSKGITTGKGVGDFDFLAGEWKVHNKRLKDGTTNEWQEFEGGATVHKLLGGMASVEELRGKDNKFLGMGVRVWLPEKKVWADHWTGYYNGVVNTPQLGRFDDGEGVFISEETVDGVAWKYRGIWDRITRKSCRWHQSSSKDGGKSWDWNWYMDWTRV